MKPARHFPALAGSVLLVCFLQGATNARAAGSPKPPLPGPLTLERTNLAEGPIVVKLRLDDGEELPFALDTGAAATILDESLEPKLGRQLGMTNSFAPFGQNATLGIYSAPKLRAGNTPLLTSPTVYTAKRPSRCKDKGVLGMDCLGHYCIQFDFSAGKMLFLDPEHLNRSELGQPFPIKSGYGGITYFEGDLFAQGKMRFMLDTGWDGPYDAMVDNKAFERLLQKFPTNGPNIYMWFPGDIAAPGNIFPNLTVCGQKYTDMRVFKGDLNAFQIKGVICMRFLTRHKVTLNFPKQTLYLKYITGAPLALSAHLADKVVVCESSVPD